MITFPDTVVYKLIDNTTLETYTLEIPLGPTATYRVLDKLDREVHGVERVQIDFTKHHKTISLTINGATYHMKLITIQCRPATN